MARKPTYEDLEQRVKDLERAEAERKQANEALQRQREELQIILDSVPAMVFYKDKENRYLRVNRVHAQTMGLAKEDLEGISLFDLSPELAEDYWEDDKKVMKSGQPKRGIIQLIETSKGRRWHVTDKIPYRDEKGDINGVIGFAVDIDERVKADEALRESEANYRTLVESANSIIVRWDTDGNIIYFNPYGLEFFKFKEEEIKGKYVIGTIVPEEETTGRDLREMIDDIITNPLKYKDNLNQNMCSDGTLVWISWTNQAILNANGELVEILSIGNDVTRRIEAEEALQKAHDELEIRIEERTAELMKANDHLKFEIEERKQAEEALREERDKIQKYFDVTGVMLLAMDADQKVILINKKGCEVLGYDEKDIIGKNWFDNFLPHRLRKEVLEVFNKLVTGEIEPVEYYENPVLTKSGEERIIAWHNTVLHDEKGKFISTVVSGEDITDHKQAEEALRESEKRFRHAFENANTGVCLVSPDGHFMRVNNRLCEIFGYGKEELEAMTVNDIAHPEDEDLSPQFYRRSISGEMENTVYEKRYIHKQGHIVWGLVSSSIVRDSGRAPLYFISHVQDITQQKLAQQALEESEEKFSKLFQASPDSIVTTLEEGRLLEVNKAFMKAIGYRCEEVIGSTTIEINLWANPEDRIKFVKLAREQGGFRDQEVNLLKKNGEPLTMLWSAEKIEIGGEDCFIGALADVTELKKTEEALRESEGKLKIKANKLEEINTALKVLLDKRDEDKAKLQGDILSNVKQLVEPYLENLKRSKLNSIQKSYLDILASNLKEIISPFIRTLSSSYLNFTPTEIKIANLVKQGKSSKEIAELINSTKCAVDFHRNSIRKKLNIKHKKLNLRTQLLSIS